MAEVVCEVSVVKCVDEFTVNKGAGRPLLRRKTAEKLHMLREGADNSPYRVKSIGL